MLNTIILQLLAAYYCVADKIESIDIEPTQLVIITDKHGPVESLKIHIEVVDILDNRRINPVDLDGVWLTLARGRYTIPFLRPGTLYGIRFKSENRINGELVVHEEERVVRTSTRTNDIVANSEPPLTVKVHRNSNEPSESVFVTASWQNRLHLSNGSHGAINVRIICDEHETKEVLQLKPDDEAISVEVTMDQKYDIQEMPRENQIKAVITPLKCHQICWSADVIVPSSFGDFAQNVEKNQCKNIGSTTITTYLRDVKRVSVTENELSVNELVVETEVCDDEKAMVRLTLYKLGDNSSEPVSQTFDANQSNGTFSVPLEDDSIYAVLYEYVKTRPFHYSSKSHFVVESPAANSTKSNHPLIEVSVIPKSFEYKKDSILKPEPPVLVISRAADYEEDMLLKVDKFCHQNATNITLNNHYSFHQIDAVDYLCSIEPKMYFCSNSTIYKKCSPILCFSTTLIISNDSYNADEKCLNVSHSFPPLVHLPISSAVLYYHLWMVLMIATNCLLIAQ